MKFLLKIKIVVSVLFFASCAFAVPDVSFIDRSPFIIAPVVEGLAVCVDAKNSPDIRKYFDASSYCGENNFNADAALNQLLDGIEPGGAKGKIQIGYTLTLPLFGLYRKQGVAWVLDEAKIDSYLNFLSKVDRPVVIYLVADHFNNQGDLSAELAKDKNNLLQFSDGSSPQSSYFGNKIIPFTLLTDQQLPVNQYRFAAFRYVAKRIAGLPASVQKKIIAITLAGELHHMFPNFEAGMGDFDGLKVTDFHPLSILSFKKWLKERYQTIDVFNSKNGFNFTDFESIPVPSKNIRTDKLNSFGDHYDGFAHGFLPFSGWMWDQAGVVEDVVLYVDSKKVSSFERGLNRLDVYRAVDEVNTPNVGFRYDFNYKELNHGRHVAQIIARVKNENYLIKSIDFNYIDRDQKSISASRPKSLESLKNISKFSGIKIYMDLPKMGQDVYFNPVAKDWNDFRSFQVRSILEKFHEIARNEGLPRSKLYSHQIVPQVNSTWNENLFAVDATLQGGQLWENGLNMYGGAANSEWVQKFIEKRKISNYGVPEFNPQQWKRQNVHSDAIMMHYKNGAKFISPYYLSITSGRKLADRKELNRMEIRPDNPVEGSDGFYKAIRDMAAH